MITVGHILQQSPLLTMAPSLKLVYFDMKGRAEAIRLALHIGGIPFEDTRITYAEFTPEMKETLPFGQLPILEIDGKVARADSK